MAKISMPILRWIYSEKTRMIESIQNKKFYFAIKNKYLNFLTHSSGTDKLCNLQN